MKVNRWLGAPVINQQGDDGDSKHVHDKSAQEADNNRLRFWVKRIGALQAGDKGEDNQNQALPADAVPGDEKGDDGYSFSDHQDRAQSFALNAEHFQDTADKARQIRDPGVLDILPEAAFKEQGGQELVEGGEKGEDEQENDNKDKN